MFIFWVPTEINDLGRSCVSEICHFLTVFENFILLHIGFLKIGGYKIAPICHTPVCCIACYMACYAYGVPCYIACYAICYIEGFHMDYCCNPIVMVCGLPKNMFGFGYFSGIGGIQKCKI